MLTTMTAVKYFQPCAEHFHPGNFKVCGACYRVSQLVGALSPVNHRGLHQGYLLQRTTIHCACIETRLTHFFLQQRERGIFLVIHEFYVKVNYLCILNKRHLLWSVVNSYYYVLDQLNPQNSPNCKLVHALVKLLYQRMT